MNSEKIKILMTLGDFELCTISKLVKKEDGTKSYTYLPISEGLMVKYCMENEETGKTTYIPIAFVRAHKDGSVHYESYGERIEQFCDTWEKVKLFRKILAEAKEFIKEAVNKTIIEQVVTE